MVDVQTCIAFQLCYGVCHQEGPREPGRTDIEWDTSAFGHAKDVNIVGKTLIPYRKTQKVLLAASKEVGLEVNPEKTEYMLSVVSEAEHKDRE
jgi:hypothetical protein